MWRLDGLQIGHFDAFHHISSCLLCLCKGPIVIRMVIAYLDVWITLQDHPETHVQRGLAASLLFALQAVPGLALLDEVLNYMPELRRWLDVRQKEEGAEVVWKRVG
jgi:hypothetical protein